MKPFKAWALVGKTDNKITELGGVSETLEIYRSRTIALYNRLNIQKIVRVEVREVKKK